MDFNPTAASSLYRPNVLGVFYKIVAPCSWCSSFPRNQSIPKCDSIDSHCQVLVGLRSDKAGWQFPQGGIDDPVDKSPIDALYREVREEIGLDPGDYEVTQALEDPICYDCDPANTKAHLKAYKGQQQYWFACAVNPRIIPDLSRATDDEFIELKWVAPSEALKNIVQFKKDAYHKGLSRLGFI